MREQFKNEMEVTNYCEKLNKRALGDASASLTFTPHISYSSLIGTSRKIVDVNIIVPNKTFMDGDKQKVVCQEPDVFDLESAIGICIAKHLCGGSSAYHKAIRSGIRVYKENLAKEKFIQEESERIEKKIAKREAYKKRRAERRREEQIEIQKEAYMRALREVNSNKGE